MAKFEIYEDAVGEYRWRLKADNGEKIASSGEGYVNKGSCTSAIALIKSYAPTATVVDLT